MALENEKNCWVGDLLILWEEKKQREREREIDRETSKRPRRGDKLRLFLFEKGFKHRVVLRLIYVVCGRYRTNTGIPIQTGKPV